MEMPLNRFSSSRIFTQPSPLLLSTMTHVDGYDRYILNMNDALTDIDAFCASQDDIGAQPYEYVFDSQCEHDGEQPLDNSLHPIEGDGAESVFSGTAAADGELLDIAEESLFSEPGAANDDEPTDFGETVADGDEQPECIEGDGGESVFGGTVADDGLTDFGGNGEESIYGETLADDEQTDFGGNRDESICGETLADDEQIDFDDTESMFGGVIPDDGEESVLDGACNEGLAFVEATITAHEEPAVDPKTKSAPVSTRKRTKVDPVEDAAPVKKKTKREPRVNSKATEKDLADVKKRTRSSLSTTKTKMDFIDDKLKLFCFGKDPDFEEITSEIEKNGGFNTVSLLERNRAHAEELELVDAEEEKEQLMEG